MRISTPQMFQHGVEAMLEKQVELTKTEQQVATGKRMLTPSDDPASTVRVMELGTASSRLDQFQRNLETTQARLDFEDTTLNSLQNLLQRVREVAVQGNNGTLGTGDRQALAVELRQHLDGYMDLVNSRDANGEYIFAGFRSDQPAMSHDGLGNFTYNGDQGQRILRVGESRSVAANDTGDVFMDIPANAGGTTNLGKIIYDLAANMEAGTADPNALADLDSALDRFLQVRASIGSRQVALDEQRKANDAFTLAIDQVRSSLEDLDYAEAISRFNQQLAGLQASQQSFIKIQGLSLFNYIR